MLRTPLLSSTVFISPKSSKRTRNIKTRVVSIDNIDDIAKIQKDIERMKACWVHTDGRQEKAYIKVIHELEKKRDAILSQEEKK
tara:strand:+ start:1347 stop:1598 length:252 start_codon:yes stop_codon:yes gene_type:complete